MNPLKSTIVAITVFLSFQVGISQNGIQLNTDEASEGFALFETFFESFLVDNCGRIVNRWPTVRGTVLHAKLLENGDIIYIQDSRVIVKDWDDNFVSLTSYDNPDLVLVYEVIVMSNGHYLCLARENLDVEDFIDLGYTYDTGNNPRRIDVVIEIDPDTETIVWQWNIKDHMLQQRDENLANYGIASENPRKMDMDAIAQFDWTSGESFMINGFDYNEELDLLALSVRKMSEVIIIDHSTTTEEASGSTGGNYGHGGDILFRWGNPQNYGQGDEEDQDLFFQHNPNWVEYGEHKGKIIMFNNRLSKFDFSSVEIIDPELDVNGQFVLPDNGEFQLAQNHISMNIENTGPFFYSEYTSGASVMPNGNIYVTAGQSGRILEMNPQGDLVWDYLIEDSGYIFRSEKYSPDFAGFEGRNLIPNGTVEDSPSPFDCSLFTTSINDINFSLDDINIIRNNQDYKVISVSGKSFSISLFNTNGQLLFDGNSNSNYRIDTSTIPGGLYYIRTERDNQGSTQSIFID